MSKLDRVSKAISTLRKEGFNPSALVMSKSFASDLKNEIIPQINNYFIDGKMEIDGVPWQISDIRGYKVEAK